MNDPMQSQRCAGETIPVPSIAEAEAQLGEIAAQAAATAGTERGERDFERLVPIVKRAALRIARLKLEDLLGSNAERDDVDDVVALAFITLYRTIHTYTPGEAFVPWFATMVRSRAYDFVRQKYHTRAEFGPEIVPLGKSALVVPARTDDVEGRLGRRETLEQLPPELRQVAVLLDEGYRTREIAEITHEKVAWVRARKQDLREELAALR